MLLYLDKLLKFAHILDVNIVPHFHMDARYLTGPAWFFYLENGIIGSNSDVEKDRLSQLQNVLNGRYIIKGIKHSISKSSAETNLVLIKNIEHIDNFSKVETEGFLEVNPHLRS